MRMTSLSPSANAQPHIFQHWTLFLLGALASALHWVNLGVRAIWNRIRLSELEGSKTATNTTDGKPEMTMRVIDVAPNEAVMTVLTDRLEEAAERGEPLTEEEIKSFLDMDPEFLETAKSMLREFFDRTENHRRQD